MRYQVWHIYMSHNLLFCICIFEEILQRLRQKLQIATLEQTHHLFKNLIDLESIHYEHYKDTLPIQIQQREQLLMNIFTRNSSVFLPSKLTNLGMFPSLKNVFVKLIFFLLFIQVSEQVHLPFLLTLFRMDFFGAAHGWGGEGGFLAPSP